MDRKSSTTMIFVPGGTYRMGSDKHYPEEAPVHRVTVDGFWIDRTPVTNRDFRKFVNDTGYVTFAEIAPDPKDYPGALPHMLKAGGGKIITIGSMMSIFASAYAAPYAASKGAIVQMARSMAVAWAKDNIQVNTILPGWIDTDLTRKAREQVEGLHDKVLARTPAQRWGTPGDFAGIAVFLAAAASDFITGAAIAVDGGYSVQA